MLVDLFCGWNLIGRLADSNTLLGHRRAAGTGNSFVQYPPSVSIASPFTFFVYFSHCLSGVVVIDLVVTNGGDLTTTFVQTETSKE